MKRTLTTWIFSVVLAALFIAHPALGEVEKAAGIVAGVEIEYPGELMGGVRQLISIKKGDTLSQRKIRDSIKMLYLKGIFNDIVVEGKDTPDGVVLVFHLVPKIRVSDIDIDGNDELSKKKIRAAMEVEEGGLIENGLVGKSRDKIISLYRDNGFPSAEVAITTKKIDKVSADLQVLVREGPPTLVSGVRVTGELAFEEKKLLGELEVEPGDILTKAALDESVEAINAYHVDRNYVNVSVAKPIVTKTETGADVVFNVTSGPRLEVVFEGNDSFSDRKLKSLLTFWADRDVSEEVITENLDKLTGFYRTNGYYFAVATSRTEESPSPPRVSVKFIIIEGPRSKIDSITFTGNESIETDDIKDVLELRESSIFKSRRVTDEAVNSDVERIKALYSSRGFLNASVNADELSFTRDGSLAHIGFVIKEGPQSIVKEIMFKGNDRLSETELRTAIKLEGGEPFSARKLEDDENSILSLYSQRGFIHANVDVEKRFSDEARQVDLEFNITEGIPVTVGRIVIAGNEQTKDKVIERELLVGTGDPYDYEKILKSQQKIFKLGFFGKTRISPVEPEKKEPVKDLLVQVKERDAGLVEFGVGYGDFDRFRGFAEVSYRNLFGLGHRISARGEASTKELKGLVGYRWPWFLDLPLDFRTNLVYLDAEKVNYTIEDLIAAAGFDKTFGENITASLTYQFEKVDLSTQSREILAPEDEGKSNLASITPSVVLDFRDNPFNPTKGSIHGLTVKYATNYIGSTVDFIKVTAQTSWYFNIYKGIVFGASARGGIAETVGEGFQVPISERFFLGGASSLRGFDLDSVSPRGIDGKPVGGDSMVLFNAEVRFPLPYGFGFVLFLDAGNVWLLNDVGGAEFITRGTNGLRYGAGVGIRYETPVGPLRLDYGFKLNPLPGEPGSELHFTLGQAF